MVVKTNPLEFGFINIDKPSGPTSFWVSDYIRRSLKISKSSHMGTLDPKVTGVLPIALGRACKLTPFLLHKEKTYIGIMRLHKEGVTLKKVKEEAKKFIGKIKQLPPVRSSVKRAIREREVFSFKILERKDKDILFETKVEAGTYIRKLCTDLGESLGGAHMLELRRIKAGIFSEDSKQHPIKTLYEFDEARKSKSELNKIVFPAEEIIKELMPHISLKEDSVASLLNGKPLMEKDTKGKIPDTLFAAFSKENFIAIYEPSNEPGILARPKFVLN